MPRTGRPGLIHRQKREFRHHWKAGQTLSEIGRALNKHAGSVRGVLAVTGGIEPRTRKRSNRALQLRDREEISRGLGQGFSFRRIARLIRRPASSVSREVSRNGGREAYRAIQADLRALVQILRPKPCLLSRHRVLRDLVAEKLALEWSPAQISGSGNTHIATLVERASRFVMLVKVEGKDAKRCRGIETAHPILT